MFFFPRKVFLFTLSGVRNPQPLFTVHFIARADFLSAWYCYGFEGGGGFCKRDGNLLFPSKAFFAQRPYLI